VGSSRVTHIAGTRDSTQLSGQQFIRRNNCDSNMSGAVKHVATWCSNLCATPAVSIEYILRDLTIFEVGVIVILLSSLLSCPNSEAEASVPRRSNQAHVTDTSFRAETASHLETVRLLCRLPMRIHTKNGHTPIRIVIGIIFLAFAVCGWGMQYKRSLYDPPGSLSTHMPHAKLLSQKERPVSSNDVSFVRPASPPSQSWVLYPAFLIAALPLGCHLAISHLVISRWMRTTTAGDDSRQQRCAHSVFFSFRPPPALLPSI
jgi:hypothetical protein